jgi:hypothetical protein
VRTVLDGRSMTERLHGAACGCRVGKEYEYLDPDEYPNPNTVQVY